MFTANEFCCFAKDNCCTKIHQFVSNIADDTVGSDTGSCIRGTAFNGHNDFGDICFFTLQAGNFYGHIPGDIGTFLDGVGDTAKFLNTDNFNMFACGRDLFIQAFNISTFTAQADDQYSSKIRAFAETDQCVRDSFKIRRHLAAALMMRKCDTALYLSADG